MFEVDVKNVTEEGRRGGEEGTSSGLGFWYIYTVSSAHIRRLLGFWIILQVELASLV